MSNTHKQKYIEKQQQNLSLPPKKDNDSKSSGFVPLEWTFCVKRGSLYVKAGYSVSQG